MLLDTMELMDERAGRQLRFEHEDEEKAAEFLQQTEKQVAKTSNAKNIALNKTWISIAQHFVNALRSLGELGQALHDEGLDDEFVTRAECELRAALIDVAKRVRF
jgi:hypothetical protein